MSAALSDAALTVIDEAKAAFETDLDFGGVTYDAFDRHLHELSASDFEYLSLLGQKLLEDGPTLPPDQAADYRRTPNVFEITVGLMKLVADELGMETAFDGVDLTVDDTPAHRSDAFQVAFHEASDRWEDADEDDRFERVWSVLIDREWTAGFTDEDWDYLTTVGAPEPIPDELSERYEASPLLAVAALGMERLAAERFAQWQQDLHGDWNEQLAIATAERDRDRAATDVQPVPKAPPKAPGWTTRLFRRKQLAPGVRLNLSKSGVSVSLGVKGGHVTYGPRGKTETIPGTGAHLQRRTPKDES